MSEIFWLILPALLLDLILGDPRWMPHPVRWIGKLIEKMEQYLRNTSLQERFSGWILALSVVFIVLFFSSHALFLVKRISLTLSHALEIWMIFTAVSLKSLRQEAMEIRKHLENNDLSEARKALSMIVGRDTEDLMEDDIIRATVETVAENFVDGVLSPLLFTLIGGGPLALAYKAINTLDSMVGYKNERYIEMGYASAKLDDAANFIPARISIPLLSIGAFLRGYGFRNTFRIGMRDRKKHPSPNAAHPEATMAGALGVQLGGTSRYQGVISEKPYLGDNRFPLEKNHILQSLRLIETTTFVFVILIFFIGPNNSGTL